MKTKIFLFAGVLLGLWLCSACEAVSLDNPSVCSSNTDCSGGEICQDSVCTPLCTDNSECEFYCDKMTGVCSKCLINSHCPDGFVCNVGKGVCMTFCGSDYDCAEGKTCLNGICSEAECSTAADCSGDGKQCLDGRCLADDTENYPEKVPCEINNLQCWDNKVVKCSADGNEWEYSHICKEDDACLVGICHSTATGASAYVCQPYSVKCATEKRTQICRPDGSQFVEWVSCPDDSLCVNGDCIIYTSDSDGDAVPAE